MYSHLSVTVLAVNKLVNPVALRKAEFVYSFGLSEYIRVNIPTYASLVCR